MWRRSRVLASAVVVLAALSLALVAAVRHKPTFYREALERSADERRRASDELLENATALASNARQSGVWRALFTAEQINGWLACDVPRNHPDLLPAEISEPCVAIDDHCVRIACRRKTSGIDVVMSLDLEVHLTARNEFSVRFRRARAGAIPLPLASVLDRITSAANDLDLRLRWLQAGGDPVAVISVRAPRADDETRLSIDTLRLAGGELYVSGHTSAGGDSYDPHDSRDQPPPAVAEDVPSKEKLTR